MKLSFLAFAKKSNVGAICSALEIIVLSVIGDAESKNEDVAKISLPDMKDIIMNVDDSTSITSLTFDSDKFYPVNKSYFIRQLRELDDLTPANNCLQQVLRKVIFAYHISTITTVNKLTEFLKDLVD